MAPRGDPYLISFFARQREMAEHQTPHEMYCNLMTSFHLFLEPAEAFEEMVRRWLNVHWHGLFRVSFGPKKAFVKVMVPEDRVGECVSMIELEIKPLEKMAWEFPDMPIRVSPFVPTT